MSRRSLVESFAGALRASVASCALAPLATALAQSPAPSSPQGYDVERSQSVQSAPRGSVGRKTTDREHRVGNAEETLGNEATYVLTFGGFARRCPTAEGIVEGDFEYSLTYDAINTDDGEARRDHHARRLVARLEGHVGDDARLEHVELEGEFLTERNGTLVPPSSDRRTVRTTFRPGASGEPDMAALRSAVEMAADVAVAAVILEAGSLYRQAELEWLKVNECLEFSFDPPSDTRSLEPNESAQVRVELRTRQGSAPVPWKSEHVNALNGIGTVSPRSIQGQPDSPATVTYTASSEPRKGHGIDLATLSRAGAATGKWSIGESDTYELEFESTIISRNPDEAAQSTATANVRLAGSNKTSPLYGDERRLYNGSGTLSYITTALAGRDDCSPLISGSGTTQLTIADAHIDIAIERGLDGTPRGGHAQIEMGYSVTIGFGGGETRNVPAVRDFKCVLLPERAQPYPFWMTSYLSSREADDQINFLNKDGWTYVGQNDVVAIKTLRGDCGGGCDEEVTVLRLKKVNPSGGR